MPPVLHVTSDKLAGSSPQNMFSRDFTTSRRKRHDVLELVAESISTAQLVKSGASPNA